MEITWKDQMGSRRRSAFLLLIKSDEVRAFDGHTIPGWCVVKGTDYTQNGKWSHTTYRIVLAPEVRHIAGHSGFETGRFVEGLGDALYIQTPDTWREVAEALDVTVAATQRFLTEWRPKAAEGLDKVEEELALLRDEQSKGERVGMKLVNLTPHALMFRDSAESEPYLAIESSGSARAAEARALVGHVDVDGLGGTIPVNRVSLGEVTGLPDPVPGVGYIVSRIVAEACPDRHDLYIVDELVRDEAGRIVGAQALAQV